MASHYECSVCHKLFDEDKNEAEADDLVLPSYARTYDYDSPEWSWGRNFAGDLDGTATISFAEIHGDEPLVLEASVVEYLRSEATCESAAVKYYVADTSNHGEIPYYSTMSDEFEEGDALVHAYGDPVAAIPADCTSTGVAEHYECSRCHKLFVYQNGEYVEAEAGDLTIPFLGELIVLSSDAISPSTNFGQEYRGRNVFFMTADKSAAVHFGSTNNTSRDVSQYSVFTVWAVNSTPGVVLTYSDGETTCYLNNDGSGGVVRFDLTARDGSNDEIGFDGTNTSRLFVTKNSVRYYFVYDVESESIVLTTDVSGVSADNYVYMYVLPDHAYGELVAEVPAGCETGGTAAHYHCSVCGKYFDASKAETTSDALVIAAQGHDYGDLIAEDDNGNRLLAHYECSLCHKLFDEDKVETTAEALAIGDGTGIYVARITANMLPVSDAPPTADLFDGFVSVTWDEIKDWTTPKSGMFMVIYAFDEGGFYYCTFENGAVMENEPTRTTSSSSNVRDLFINTYGYVFYYTTGS